MEKQVQSVTIKEEIVDPDDKEMIEDLVQLAMNDALNKVDAETERVMSKYTQELGWLTRILSKSVSPKFKSEWHATRIFK